jgi:CheY-like chemotaxis protein
MGGLETLRAIRANPNTVDVPVIMLTANTQDDDYLAAREAGANGYLTKPFSRADVLESVARRPGPRSEGAGEEDE